MARPVRDGVEYFPFDVSLDEKFELIEAEFGLTGFAVVVKLYQRIYGRGYFCEWTKEVALLFGHRIGLGGNVVSEIVSASIKRGIFDQGMFDKYSILTSHGIQERYFEAVNRRKNVKVNKQYLLINVTQILVNVDINWENVNINSENVSRSTQSKVKKSKVNKTKVNNAIPAEIAREFDAYLDMRKRSNKPMTDYAVKLALGELNKLAPDDYEQQKEIINQSVLHSWQGLYALKQQKQTYQSSGENNHDLDKFMEDSMNDLMKGE